MLYVLFAFRICIFTFVDILSCNRYLYRWTITYLIAKGSSQTSTMFIYIFFYKYDNFWISARLWNTWASYFSSYWWMNQTSCYFTRSFFRILSTFVFCLLVTYTPLLHTTIDHHPIIWRIQFSFPWDHSAPPKYKCHRIRASAGSVTLSPLAQ